MLYIFCLQPVDISWSVLGAMYTLLGLRPHIHVSWVRGQRPAHGLRPFQVSSQLAPSFTSAAGMQWPPCIRSGLPTSCRLDITAPMVYKAIGAQAWARAEHELLWGVGTAGGVPCACIHGILKDVRGAGAAPPDATIAACVCGLAQVACRSAAGASDGSALKRLT